jgi:hypothetical protein
MDQFYMTGYLADGDDHWILSLERKGSSQVLIQKHNTSRTLAQHERDSALLEHMADVLNGKAAADPKILNNEDMLIVQKYQKEMGI